MEVETVEKEKDKLDTKDEKAAAAKHDDKVDSSENKTKSELEEDVVIVKDDEEEVEKREVLIHTRLSISFICVNNSIYMIICSGEG